MTAEDTLSQEMRLELEARLNAYKNERAKLIAGQSRIAELDELIAFIEYRTPTIKVAPRPTTNKVPSTPIVSTTK